MLVYLDTIWVTFEGQDLKVKVIFCLHCLYTVGWASGRASSL